MVGASSVGDEFDEGDSLLNPKVLLVDPSFVGIRSHRLESVSGRIDRHGGGFVRLGGKAAMSSEAVFRNA